MLKRFFTFFQGLLWLFAASALLLASPGSTWASPHTAQYGQKELPPFLKTFSLSEKNPLFIPALKPNAVPRIVPKKLRGWNYLYTRLVEYGMNPAYLKKLLTDKRLPKRDTIYFKLQPRESKQIYRSHNTKLNHKRALECYKENRPYFTNASNAYAVPKPILVSVLQVETKCGEYMGRKRAFYRLARLVSLAEPENVEKNHKEKQKKDKSLALDAFQKRANWLEETFLPHAISALVVAEQAGLHPHELRGSIAGAIGMPQFLPGNSLLYGVDADKDGKVNLFTPPDAIYSLARFLNENGWNADDLSIEAQREVIRKYNNSESYINTVLAMAKVLEKEINKKPSS